MNTRTTKPQAVSRCSSKMGSGANRRFARHYAEMVAVMFLGMAVLYLPIEGALGAMDTSTSQLQSDAPAAALLAMALSMTAPMVAWMRFRGHSWRLSMEMAASMFVPTLVVIGLLAGALVKSYDTLLLIEHVAMLPSMLVAMLLRRQEYSAHVHGHRTPQKELAT